MNFGSMITFKYYGKLKPEQIQKLSVDEFCEYMAEWDMATDENWHKPLLSDADMPKFESKEEARKSLGGISFDEFEGKYLK